MKTISKIITKLSPKWRIVYNHICYNWKFKENIKMGNFTSSDTACTFRTMEVKQSVNFICTCFNNMTQYSGLGEKDFSGKRILEVGHGENVGIALKFIASGASHVVCIDRFYATRDQEHEYKIYEELRNSLENEEEKSRFDSAIQLERNHFKLNDKSISCHYGVDIAKAHKTFPSQSFDFIYSNAVLEHVGKVGAGFYSMDKLLKPGGSMVHIVDFKDHGMFSSSAMHPLTFLTIPHVIYRLMTSESGQPNRIYPDFYRKMMLRLGYDYKIFIMQVVSSLTGEALVKKPLPPNITINDNSGIVALKKYKEHIEKGIDYSDEDFELMYMIKPHLTRRFRLMSDRDLMTAAILLTCRKAI